MGLALTVGGILLVFLIGYWLGFRACFDYLVEELERKMEEDDD